MKINYTFIEAVVNPFALEPAPIDMYSHFVTKQSKIFKWHSQEGRVNLLSLCCTIPNPKYKVDKYVSMYFTCTYM